MFSTKFATTAPSAVAGTELWFVATADVSFANNNKL